MKTTHTPAPWQLTFGENDAAIHNDVTIASINDDALAWEANAHLIAAAPDLLSAARNAANVLAALATGQLAEIKPDSNALQELRAAIAKAEGAA